MAARRRSGIPPAAAYAGPFAVFLVLLSALPAAGLAPRATLAIWVVVLAAAVVLLSRGVIDWRPSRPLLSTAVGCLVFAVWVLPDLAFPGWRSHWAFQNPLTGGLTASLPPESWRDPVSVALRILRAVALVPVIEELFWRGWLMRWLIKSDFESVPLGAYARGAFWWTAALFALEHGAYWDVGLMAGVAYNLWMMRTRKLGDLILAHAVTNGCLSAYILASSRWQYWM